MKIFKRGKSLYADFTVHGKRYRVSLGTDNKTEAKEIAEEKYREKLSQSPEHKKGKLKVSELKNIYLKGKTAKSTICNMDISVRWFCKVNGDMRIEDIKPEHLHNLVAFRKKNNYAIETINGDIRRIKTLLNIAVANEYLLRNRCASVKQFRTHREPPNILSPEQIKMIEAELSGYWLDMFHFFIYTGMRRAEVTMLQWKDINAEFITVHGKGDITRTVPINDNLRKTIMRMGRGAGRLFPCRIDSVSQKFRKIVNKVGIVTDKPTHIFRQTFISQSLMAGVDVTTVGFIVGHTDSKSLEKQYVNIISTHKKKAVNMLPY